MKREEVEAVLGHEVTHVANKWHGYADADSERGQHVRRFPCARRGL